MMSYVTTVTALSAIYIPDLVEVGPRATESYLLRLYTTVRAKCVGFLAGSAEVYSHRT